MQSTRQQDGTSGKNTQRSPGGGNDDGKWADDVADEAKRDNLKVVLSMIVDDVWKNYDSYTL